MQVLTRWLDARQGRLRSFDFNRPAVYGGLGGTQSAIN